MRHLPGRVGCGAVSRGMSAALIDDVPSVQDLIDGMVKDAVDAITKRLGGMVKV